MILKTYKRLGETLMIPLLQGWKMKRQLRGERFNK